MEEITKLKAEVYDHSVQIQFLQQKIQETNQVIADLQSKEEKKAK